MDEILKDKRFAHIPKDPAFKRIPKRERKVKIDKRFQSMFSDERFKVKYTVDKRGRPVRNSSSENLRRYYALDSSNESEETSDEDSNKLDSEAKTRHKGELKSEINKSHEEKKGKKEYNNLREESGSLKKKDGRERDYLVRSSLHQPSRDTLLSEENSEDEDESDREGSDSDFHEGDGNDELVTEYRTPDQKVQSRLQDMTVDYARGEGMILTDSSSDEESSDDEEEEEDGEEAALGWGELGQDAGRTDESTRRLAVCGADWDRIRAHDLMVLLHSFVPKGGVIHSVTVYPSEYGLQRMREEEEKGPLELRAGDAAAADSDVDEDGKNNKKKKKQRDDEVVEGDEYQREKLRQYQLKRLRYYYAVVVCDSVASADVLYQECDGMEYESSASHLDLRFIPDDTTFDQEPRETCTELPNMMKYEPQQFVTTALQQSKVRLTWDETDPRRLKFNQKINSSTVDEIDDNDLKVYLASSSSEEKSSGDEEDEDKKDSALKYRALLESMDSQEATKSEKNMEMEVTWGINLKEKVQQKLKDGKEEELTPFQKYLQKRKEKRRAKQLEQLKKKQQLRESAGESDERSASEDDVPSDIDMNDQYFKEEFEKEEFAHKKKTKSKSKKKKNKKDSQMSEDEESKKQKAELELLLMDEDDNKKHFSLKDILVEDTKSKKKKKKKNQKKEEESAGNEGDDFQINVQDKRFSALFTSHLYNIDPADPHYKKTRGMEALRQEKLTRRELDEELPTKKQKTEIPEKNKQAELSLLVKNIKRKTQALKK